MHYKQDDPSLTEARMLRFKEHSRLLILLITTFFYLEFVFIFWYFPSLPKTPTQHAINDLMDIYWVGKFLPPISSFFTFEFKLLVCLFPVFLPFLLLFSRLITVIRFDYIVGMNEYFKIAVFGVSEQLIHYRYIYHEENNLKKLYAESKFTIIRFSEQYSLRNFINTLGFAFVFIGITLIAFFSNPSESTSIFNLFYKLASSNFSFLGLLLPFGQMLILLPLLTTSFRFTNKFVGDRKQLRK